MPKPTCNIEHPNGATPATYALSALMYPDAARLPARVNESGNLNSLFEQNRPLWDSQLVAEGLRWFLDLSADGPELTRYHLGAVIAWVHAKADHTENADWECIASLRDQLMTIRPSPVVELNRVIAIAQRDGPGKRLGN
jgi:predicted RNA polymerase sigma factor